MNDALKSETARLEQSWQRHDQHWLRDYLVGSVEDPRLNIPSVLTRHLLIERLAGSHWAALMEAELRFALCLTWLVKQTELGAGPEDFAAVAHALGRGADNAEGTPLPVYLGQTLAGLPADLDGVVVPDYLTPLLQWLADQANPCFAQAPGLNEFARLWRACLNPAPAPQPRVIEAACGSANDFRAIADFGLAGLIEYHGFDLCEKNIANARAMFPQARFDVANVFAIPASDRAYELGWTHDLLEHLSPDGRRQAIGELCRVTRNWLSIGFFNMHEEPASIIRPVEDYHWNTLSVDEVRQEFEAEGFGVQVISIAAFLRQAFGCEDTHNRNAYTFRCYRKN